MINSRQLWNLIKFVTDFLYNTVIDDSLSLKALKLKLLARHLKLSQINFSPDLSNLFFRFSIFLRLTFRASAALATMKQSKYKIVEAI